MRPKKLNIENAHNTFAQQINNTRLLLFHNAVSQLETKRLAPFVDEMYREHENTHLNTANYLKIHGTLAFRKHFFRIDTKLSYFTIIRLSIVPIQNVNFFFFHYCINHKVSSRYIIRVLNFDENPMRFVTHAPAPLFVSSDFIYI